MDHLPRQKKPPAKKPARPGWPPVVWVSLLMGSSALLALWVGGSGGVLGERIARATDRAIASSGFELTSLNVEGLSASQRAQLQAQLAPPPGSSVFAVDLVGLRNQLLEYDWVDSVEVRRLLPHRLDVIIRPRAQAAVLLDRAQMAPEETDTGTGTQALMVEGLELRGAGARAAARTLLDPLEDHPVLRARIAYATYVGQRRWTLVLDDNISVLLPENPKAALGWVEDQQARHRVLDGQFRVIDLRVANRTYLRPIAGLKAPAASASLAPTAPPAGGPA